MPQGQPGHMGARQSPLDDETIGSPVGHRRKGGLDFGRRRDDKGLDRNPVRLSGGGELARKGGAECPSGTQYS